MRRLGPALLLSLFVATPAPAVTIEWTPIGDAGNACDPQPDGSGGTGCYGAVGYDYLIGTYEVTNAQYADFLNAKARTDPYGLYSTGMGAGYGGITRGFSSGSYTYSAIPGRENMPVNNVSFYDAVRFANWMNNGQGSGDTETGAYFLAGGTEIPSNATTITRDAGATIFVTSEDEWYKAAYYDSSSASYFYYPARSDSQTTCAAPSALPNVANCNNAVGDLTNVGSYTGSASPYGTFDQGGNVWEWNEAIEGSYRAIRGGAFSNPPDVDTAEHLSGSYRAFPNDEEFIYGFRIAMIPEPSTGLLVIGGLLGLARRRTGRA